MTLRPEYRLGHSEFNGFLFAPIGEDRTGIELTIFSALTRLGLDPWREAARLAALSRKAATQALAATMSKLPEGDWTASELEAIAARLVGLLPGPTPQTASDTVEKTKPKSGLVTWLVWFAVLVLAIFLIAQGLQSSRDFEPPWSESAATQQ